MNTSGGSTRKGGAAAALCAQCGGEVVKLLFHLFFFRFAALQHLDFCDVNGALVGIDMSFHLYMVPFIALECLGIFDGPGLAKRNTEHGSGLGRWRWVIERTFAWLNQFRRLRVRYEKRADIHEAFLSLGCALICWHFLRADWMRN